jgi:hypothetical protein
MDKKNELTKEKEQTLNTIVDAPNQSELPTIQINEEEEKKKF